MSSRASNLTGRLSRQSSRHILGRHRIVALTVAVWAVAGALLLTLQPRPIALAGALAIGWSHLLGRCGVSHFGALTPRGKIPGRHVRWLAGALTYVAAGAFAATVVGASLAALGRFLVPGGFRAVAVGVTILLAVVAAASELRLIRWRLPQPNLQTRRHWGMFRSPIPEVLWGFCLGLTFATVFTFSGTWLVLALPFALGEPTFGAMVLLAHWLGRATPILVGPLLLDDAARTEDLLEDIERAHRMFRASNIIGIGLMGLSLVILLRDVAT